MDDGEDRLNRIEDCLLQLAETMSLMNNTQSSTYQNVQKLLDNGGEMAEMQLRANSNLLQVMEVAQLLAENQRAFQEIGKLLDERMKDLVDSQRHTDERLDALVDIVQGLIRRQGEEPPAGSSTEDEPDS
jgi:galactokinase